MKINKLNYENFVIDYIEGSLDASIKKEFDGFLTKYPEVYEEIKDFMSAPILEEDTSITFDNKSSLRKGFPYQRIALATFITLAIIASSLYYNQHQANEQTLPEIETQNIIQFADSDEKMAQPAIIESDQIETAQIETAQIEKESQPEIEATPIMQKKIAREQATLPPTSVINQQEAIVQLEETKSNKIYEKYDAPIVIATKPQKSSLQQTAKAMMASLIPIGKMNDLNNITTEDDQDVASMTLQVDEFENSVEENKFKKPQWFELITPSSFDDLNIKDALAITSTGDDKKGRKLLNAFIPQTLTK